MNDQKETFKIEYPIEKGSQVELNLVSIIQEYQSLLEIIADQIDNRMKARLNTFIRNYYQNETGEDLSDFNVMLDLEENNIRFVPKSEQAEDNNVESSEDSVEE